MADAAPQTTTATISQWETWRGMAGLSLTGDYEAALQYATAEVQRICGRTFIASPADGVPNEVRTFPGTGIESLSIDDCLEIASVVVNGGTVDSTGYLAKGVGGKLPYTYLVRQALSAYLIAEYAEVSPWFSSGIWPESYDVTITGAWGYAAAVPDEVVEATCMLAATRMKVSPILAASSNVKSFSAGAVSQTFVAGTEAVAALRAYRDDAKRLLMPFQRWD